jgi:hypothetical protein
MKAICFFLVFCLMFLNLSFANHNRGGKIEARFISGLTYEISITTYTRTSSAAADRPTLDSVHLGDGSIETFVRLTKINEPNDVSVNIYTKNHTYSSPGTFLIFLIDPNREGNINNIPNSINTQFAIDAELVISSNSCQANLPFINAQPIFTAVFGKDFVLSTSAFVLDKDSLTYTIIPCQGNSNIPIPGYFLPMGITLDLFTGEFIWKGNTMSGLGIYAFAVQVNKWRNGVYFGHIIEDFTVNVAASADTVFNFIYPSVSPVDTNGNFISYVLPNMQINIHLEYFDSSSAIQNVQLYSAIDTVLPLISYLSNSIESVDLTWTPSQANVRKTPYTLVFRGEPGEKDLMYQIYVIGIDSNQCSSPISVPEISFDENNIHIYPNPVHENLQIECTFKTHSQINYTLTDMLGRNLFETKTNDTFLNIAVNNFASGIYFLRIENAGEVYIRKINVY